MIVLEGLGVVIRFDGAELDAPLLGIDLSGADRAAIESTHLGTVTAKTYKPAVGSDLGEIDILMDCNPESVRLTQYPPQTIEIIYPLQPGETTTQTLRFRGFVTRQGSQTMRVDQRTTTRLLVKLTGQETVRSNGYCRQFYSSTWDGTVWGAPVATGPATCEASFPDGANVWELEPWGASLGNRVVPGDGSSFVSWTVTPGDYLLSYLSGAVDLGAGSDWTVSNPPNGTGVMYRTQPSGSWTWLPDRGRGATQAEAEAGAAGLTQVITVPMGETSIELGMNDPYLENNLGTTTFKLQPENSEVATGVFANALGVGDFDCVVGGEACASVPAPPCLLPAPPITPGSTLIVEFVDIGDLEAYPNALPPGLYTLPFDGGSGTIGDPYRWKRLNPRPLGPTASQAWIQVSSVVGGSPSTSVEVYSWDGVTSHAMYTPARYSAALLAAVGVEMAPTAGEPSAAWAPTARVRIAGHAGPGYTIPDPADLDVVWPYWTTGVIARLNGTGSWPYGFSSGTEFVINGWMQAGFKIDKKNETGTPGSYGWLSGIADAPTLGTGPFSRVNTDKAGRVRISTVASGWNEYEGIQVNTIGAAGARLQFGVAYAFDQSWGGLSHTGKTITFLRPADR